MQSFTAVFKVDESGLWFAYIKELQGCHTQARTLKQAKARIREALGLFIEETECHSLNEEFSVGHLTDEEIDAIVVAEAETEDAWELEARVNQSG